MFSPFIRKLGHGAELLQADYARLSQLAPTRRVEAYQDIISQGDRPENVHLILSGIACRYKMLNDGSRQIMALLLPGDLCDLNVAILSAMDHGIATLSPCTVAYLPQATILDLIKYPRIARALSWATLVDTAILREWLVNLGRRDTNHRLAHLICELRVRLQMAGVGDPNGYQFPIIQRDLADVLGVTSVHINRTLQFLREEGLIKLQRRWIEIPDVERLEAFCDFNSGYLHLVKRFE